ncbi:carbohydrate ABC transporter permease [Arthrobacter zhangbolii]|uniref:Carbohydrate ABC transporter permease n=1 Tax=Arthrobacter zhangbolii TaxID=2886936 RepID=A0A9X1MA27_9MICC|nr:carbohydrate ABC transporter permease [Arthrobacter zhangbolii]MCC3274088.1 carbohydrate ABC transporter permease [Arthrobacter zhangbolii]UON92881.1 carbohydrate ABC transporter permease [Arthrobacter zhangbolii]
MRNRTRKGWRKYVNTINISAVVIALLTALPIYWLFASSFKPTGELGALPPSILPQNPTLDHYREAFGQYSFSTYMLNSVLIASVTTAVVLALALFSGYALARMPVRGKAPLLVGLLVISVFPTIAVLTPLYLLERSLGMLNSYHGLILPYIAFNLPFAVWIMRNYLKDLPFELEESARMDGASSTRTVLSIILPAARPGLFTAGIFTFTASFTEFLMAMTFNSEDNFRTVPVGIALFGSEFDIPYGTIFAASVIAILPIAILVLVFRKSVVSGMTAGAVKG